MLSAHEVKTTGNMNPLPLFIVLLVSQAYSPASADRKFGCLFQNKLCSPYEICVNDGMFGRCHSVAVKDVYTYDVPPATVQRFRLLLEKLSSRGLTWEDEATQQVLAQELSKLKRIPSGLLENRPIYNAGSRLGGAAVLDPADQSVKPVEAQLNRNLQMYLQRLGLLPQTASLTSSLQSPSKSDGFQSGTHVDYYHPRTLATGQRLPPSRSSFQRESPRPQSQLLAALRRLLSGAPLTAPRRGPFYGDGGERSGLNEETSDSRLWKMAGGQRWPVRDPLSTVDERFIQKVLRNVGQQHLNMEDLSPQDLDQLSGLIADALQVVDPEKAGQTRDGPEPRGLGEESREDEGEEEEEEEEDDAAPTEKSQMEEAAIREAEQRITGRHAEAVQPITERHAEAEQPITERHAEAEPPITGVKDVNLFSKLLAYLDTSAVSETPPSLTDRPAGLENVQSRSTQAEVRVQKKDATQAVEEVSEVEGWIREVVPPPAAAVRQQPGQKAAHMPQLVHVPELQLDVKAGRKKGDDDIFGYVITDTDGLQTDEGLHLMEILARMANIQMTDVAELSVVGPAVTFKIHPNRHNVSTADVANVAIRQKEALEKEARVKILEAGVAEGSEINQIPTKYSQAESTKFLVLTMVSILCIVGVLLASTVVYCLRHRSHHKLKEKLTNLATDTGSDATTTYQELCRQRMAVKPPAERSDPTSSRINSVSSQFSDGGPAVSPSARSSTSSWSEEPTHSNMDISTGHMILAYMEDHLKNKDRLEKEWEALCSYQAEPNATAVGLSDGNAKRNRSSAVVAYDHSRIRLKVENSQGNSDYINASPIMDHDPRNPSYIATQGPLPSTVADFWQMVWENGCVVIVMLTPLVEGGAKQCYHYWPDEGSNLYHIYEVNLVSEHIWCEDFLVRSFYLKNMQTNETRTVTQFHFLTWLHHTTPESNRPLLDFRRKVNRCYRGRSCPIIVHCSDGAGRAGTYILIDMVLNKMAKGAKEIDIAATLEHLRDQRAGMVQSKEQFEFALTAVAEEVNVILKALPQ